MKLLWIVLRWIESVLGMNNGHHWAEGDSAYCRDCMLPNCYWQDTACGEEIGDADPEPRICPNCGWKEGDCECGHFLEGDALRDEIMFHNGAGQCALAMDDFEAADMHNLKVDRLMHGGKSSIELLPMLDRPFQIDDEDMLARWSPPLAGLVSGRR